MIIDNKFKIGEEVFLASQWWSHELSIEKAVVLDIRSAYADGDGSVCGLYYDMGDFGPHISESHIFKTAAEAGNFTKNWFETSCEKIKETFTLETECVVKNYDHIMKGLREFEESKKYDN